MASGILPKGTALSGYRIDGVLGQGGMGIVYEATQLSLQRVVALKVLADHLSDDVSFTVRFQREGQIQAGIDHPNIVTVFDSGQSEHGFFIAMRLVRGPNLKDMIISRELDAGRALRILTPIAEALDTAHQAGLVHRDIKPQNILVGGRDQAYLADFGLTKASGDKTLTRTGQFVGTLDYIAPEQIKGEKASAKSDVYALAAVLYECLTGIVPFPKDSEAAVLYAHMADPAPRISESRPDLPGALDEVLMRAMSKDPGERQASGGELLAETNEAFTRGMRAAFTVPGPLESPEETGIRRAEYEVPTREGDVQRAPDTAAGETNQGAPDTAAGQTRPGAPGTAPGVVPADDTIAAPAGATEVTPTASPTGATPTTASPTELTPTAGETEVTSAKDPSAPQAAPTGAREHQPPAPSEGRPPARERTPPERVTHDREAPRASAGASEPKKKTGQLLLGAAVVLLALAVAGFLLGKGGSGGEGSKSGGGNPVTAGAVELTPPEGWSDVDEPDALQGLDLRDAATVGASGGGTLTVGMTKASLPTLLPTAFLSRLDNTPARDDAVELGDLRAYRYKDLEPKGADATLTLYAAPTSDGVATVACVAPPGGAEDFFAECESAAASARLTEGEALDLKPDDYVGTLNGVIGQLNRTREDGVSALRKAKKVGGQAKAAAGLAKDYGVAAKSLGDATVGPERKGENQSILAALGRIKRGYEAMARAARESDTGAYDAGRGDVRKGEKALKAALGRVKKA